MIVPGIIAGAIAAGSSSHEPADYNNVSLHIHGDARPFIDVSTNEHPVINRSGGVVLTSGRMDFGTVASHSNVILVPTSTGYAFGTGAWAVIAKVTCDANGARVVDARITAAATDAWAIAVQPTTRHPFIQVGSTTYGLGTPAANLAVPDSTETEVKFNYDGTVLRCFVGGALSWSHTVSLNVTAPNRIAVGNLVSDSASGYQNQLLREVLIVKGEACGTADYTPPTSYSDTGNVIEAAAVPTFANVELLLHGAGSNGSTTITDSSSAARTLTAFGNLQISNAQARFGSTSIAFDGSGDYASIPSSTDFAFGTGDFSVGAQVYASNAAAQKVLLSCYGGTTTGWTWHIVNTTGAIGWNGTGDGVDITTGAVLGTGAWKEVVLARKSGLLLALFETVSGYLEAVAMLESDTSNITCPTNLLLGRFPGFSEYWNGYMQEVRVIKGESIYARSHIGQTGAWPDS